MVVLDGGWDRVNRNEDPDAPRRLYYVAMTRARHTLALSRLPTPHPFQDALRDNPAVQWREPTTLPSLTPDLARRYRRLTLRDVNLGFAGYKPPGNPTHRAIAELAPGDQLQARPQSDWWELRNYAGVVVGTLARKFEAPSDMRCVEARVLAVATWSRDRSDPQYQQHLKKRHLGGRNPRTHLRAPQVILLRWQTPARWTACLSLNHLRACRANCLHHSRSTWPESFTSFAHRSKRPRQPWPSTSPSSTRASPSAPEGRYRPCRPDRPAAYPLPAAKPHRRLSLRADASFT